MKSIDELHKLGQSLWYDNIQRSLLDNGEMAAMIARGEIKGVTSNPSIFQNAIVKSNDYDAALKPMSWAGLTAEEIFWELAVKDIQDAADLFLPLYQSSNKKDGYVSLEVSPYLAKDTDGTIREARRLWEKVNRPNLMIKIPATLEGIPAIRQTIASGINVNVTLIFSITRYEAVIDAFLSGLEDRVKEGKGIENIASVASFFISRVDTKVDALLQKSIETGSLSADNAKKIIGRTAIANARLAYQVYKKIFESKRFTVLKEKGAQNQRPLWASTSTKNPNYRDVIYVEELIGAETVNTLPPATLIAFKDHGKAAVTIVEHLQEAQDTIRGLEKVGISIKQVTDDLEKEGVKAFADAFTSLLQSVEERRSIQAESLTSFSPIVKKRLEVLQGQDFLQRFINHDPSLWTKDPKGQEEIRVRMNWVSAPWKSENLLSQLENLLPECRKAGFTHALLLGMGGSSLAPEVMRLINGQSEYRGVQGLDLSVLDSTNPDEVLAAQQRCPMDRTLFIVASKSGTTGEINAFYHYFWEQATQTLGEKAGRHFIAITDPDTKLAKLAKEQGFWKIFIADPQVGGRNSALTAFGLVPAALIGIDIRDLLLNAQKMAQQCQSSSSFFANPGIVLGAFLAETTLLGKNKLTLLTDSNWSSFGNWLEQLIAESSGKEGKGIIPVANEPGLSLLKYGNDRFFVYLRSNGENDSVYKQICQMGHPALMLDVSSALDLGGQFYLWEFATAVACSILGVNSFDQPDVQDAKTRTLAGISEYRETGKLKQGQKLLELADGDVYSTESLTFGQSASLRQVIDQYLSNYLMETDYIAINAFLPRTKNLENDLQELRKSFLKVYGKATTLGFGPRFLHSTGQLHKGGPNCGLFIEITSDFENDFDIPGEGISFGTMAMAQALGDYQALEVKQRRILRIHLRKPAVKILLKE